MQKAKIVLLGIVAAVSYGIIHDQITVRLCIEYFTVAHPPLFHTASPTLLAICWGTVATFWVGIALGALLALVSQSEGLPPVSITRLGRGIAILLAAMAVSASAAGFVGFELARHSVVSFPVALGHFVPRTHHDRFMAVWFAHNTSYLIGFAGGGVWIFRIWNERGRPRVLSPLPRTKLGIARALVLAGCIALILYLQLSRS